MAPKKKPSKVVKLQLKAGQANPAPPVGTALGPTGIQIADFCKQFNDATKDRMGMVLPTIINIYDDRSFDFITKQPPVTYLIKTELNLKSGSKLPHKDKVANLTLEQLKKIAGLKMVDLNAHDEEHAMSIIAGSARSMGITTDMKKQ
ncbi:MAG: 50S ribosomal protein L11 [Candidatus Gracilibacteria bacterium]|nr:50S ribosomal protein L11 [Candidatus Gracilibacteria bacterium]